MPESSTYITNIRLSRELYELVHSLADGRTMTEVVRQALEAWCRTHPTRDDRQERSVNP